MEKLIEIDFGEGIDNTRIVIKAVRVPSVEEANRWLESDVRKFGKVTRVAEISREEAETFYDFTNESKWKVFGIDSWTEIDKELDELFKLIDEKVAAIKANHKKTLELLKEPLKTYEVYTQYHRTVRARTQEEAKKIAMNDLDHLDGLGGEWVWSEDIDHTIKVDDEENY